MRFRGRRRDGGNGSFNDGRWKGGSRDVLKDNVFSKIVSKVLMDKRILGGRREEVFLFVFLVLGLVGSNVGKDVKTDNWGRGDGSAGDDISGAVRDVEEGIIFWVVEDRPGKLGGWGMWDKRSGGWGILEFRGLRGNGLEDTGGDVERTWVIPSVVRALKDLKDGGGGVHNILLIDIIKGGPGSNRDVGEGRGGNGGGL